MVALGSLAWLPMPSTLVGADEGQVGQSAPLEIERQQIDGRLSTIERRLDDHRGTLIPVAPTGRNALQTPGGATAPGSVRGNDPRLDLERRGLEQRQRAVERDLGRMSDGNPSSTGLLRRLRGD